MKKRWPANYLRAHRKRAGLSQRDLGRLLGSNDPGMVSRHERASSLPSLLVALAYERIYRVPVASLFGELQANIRTQIDSNLSELESKLGQRSALDRGADLIAQKLMWLQQRRG